MSGHSKWSQIKRQKGVADIKRGQTFTKVANAITIAVRQGGGIADPESNFKLRLAIEKARTVNMPKENIQRAIDRTTGKGGAGEGRLEEVVYEGFGPGGVAVMVECVTDNRERTRSEIKNLLDKNGGTLGQSGTVAYQFKQVGIVTVKKDNMSLDNIFTKAADSGADDIEEVHSTRSIDSGQASSGQVGDEVLIYTEPSKLKAIKDKLTESGLTVADAELSRKPTIIVPITDKDSSGKIILLVEKLESLDDVQKVYANFEIPEELL